MKIAHNHSIYERFYYSRTHKPCLIFTCLEMQNYMRTFWGSDGRFYRNEPCPDNTNGETAASADIKGLLPNTSEKKLLEQWNKVLSSAKKTGEYNSELTYGIYQIYAELDISRKDEETERIKWVYPELHGHLQTLKSLVKEYYNSEIVPILFQYEFLK